MVTLNDQTKAIVKATIPALEAHGLALTRHFYERMFRENPEVRAFFNPANQAAGTQQRALAGAILGFARHIDDLGALSATVKTISAKHASLTIRPEHYPLVGANLLEAIKEVLGEAATPEILAAWADAYAALAEILIEAEASIYARQKDRDGGFAAFAPFQVVRKERESDVITSFYLRPRDGSPTPAYEAGQYITVRIPFAPTATTMRNYSLSRAPRDDGFRISVKREAGAAAANIPEGAVSTYLHDVCKVGDTIEVGPPCGEFVLGEDRHSDRPLVFLAGGIGITPLISMLEEALAEQPNRTILFAHACRTPAVQPFRDALLGLAAAHPSLAVRFLYSDAGSNGAAPVAGAGSGRIDEAFLGACLPEGRPIYFFCGPAPFMRGMRRLLLRRGVPLDSLRSEFFGPAQDLEDEPAAEVDVTRARADVAKPVERATLG